MKPVKCADDTVIVSEECV